MFPDTIRFIRPTERFMWMSGSQLPPTRGRPKTDATEFSIRLAKACDADPDCPNSGRGRYKYIVEGCTDAGRRVSLASVSKWLCARTIPTPPNMEALAGVLGTTVDYLAYGKGPMKPDRKVLFRAAKAEAHVNLIMAFLREEGLQVGIIGEDDPWRESAQLATTINSKPVYIYVASADLVREGEYRFRIPRKHAGAMVVGVIRRSAFSYDLL